MPVVRSVVRQAATDDYRFDTLLVAIVNSAPFRMQQVPAAAPAESLQASTAH
jgi:hypothetical protein